MIELGRFKAKTEVFFEKNPAMRSIEGECRGLSLADA